MAATDRLIIAASDLELYQQAATSTDARVYNIITPDEYIGPGEINHPGRKLREDQVSLKILNRKEYLDDFWDTLGKLQALATAEALNNHEA